MAGTTVSQIAACTPPTTRTEQPDASCRLTHATTTPGARRPRRWIMDQAGEATLSPEPASALCGGFATTA